MLSFPMKWTIRVSSSFQYFSQSSVSSLVAEMYPIGASNQTYSTLPSAPSTGTGTPQSRSRLTALGFSPWSIHDLHCPYTLGFHSLCSSRIHCFSQGSYWSSGRYQCLVSFTTGLLPLSLEVGSIRSVGLSEVPHCSHWSP